MAIIGNPIIIGGGEDFFAAILVNYPVGSVCTCSNGDKTMTAPTTNGKYTFVIPKVTLPSTWTLSSTDGTNSDSKAIIINEEGELLNVTLEYIHSVLNDNSWDIISMVAQQGAGDTYWDLGDAKEIVLNGKIGNYLTLNNYTTYVFILDFNHPTNKTQENNNIIFGGFKSANGSVICLCDSLYDRYVSSGEIAFTMNHYCASSSDGSIGYNQGGWKACDFRYDILGAVETPPSNYLIYKPFSASGVDATRTAIVNPIENTLMAALPSDFRNVLQLHTHYTNNKGKSNDDSAFTQVVDAGIFLPTMTEVYGEYNSIGWMNSYEKNHTQQMSYYAIGNVKIKKRYDDINTIVTYYTATPMYNNNEYWIVNTKDVNDISPTLRSSFNGAGLSPAFKV